MFKKLFKKLKSAIMPEISEMVSKSYARAVDIINKESIRINELKISLETLKSFMVEQQKEIDEIKQLIKKRGR